MDFFSMFNIPVETPAEKDTKKTETKPKKTASAKGGNKSSSKKPVKKEELYKLPITVYTGYREPFSIEANEAKYKEGITLKQLKQEIEAICPEYPAKVMLVEVDSKSSKAWAALNSMLAVRKGNLKLNKDTLISLAGHEIDHTSVMTDTECEVSIDELKKTFETVHPAFAYAGFVAEGNVITPVFDEGKMPSELKFPIRLCLYGRENWQIAQEEYNAFLTEKGNTLEGDGKYDEDMVREMITARYPDFDGDHLRLHYMDKENIVLVTMYVKPVSGATAGKKKEELYPTEGTTLSFIFNKVPLSPELFDGKKEVSKKELISYCATLYPEYDNENTQIRYDKERKLIIPVLQGSSKGAVSDLKMVTDEKELEALKNSGCYELFNYMDEQRLYRVESTPVSFIKASKENPEAGTYEYRLPKIPGSILKSIVDFIMLVEKTYGTEVLVRIYWDPDKEEYLFELPEQEVSPSSVMTREPLMDGVYPIMDIHSHCHYDAFFSVVDNADEVGSRLYGVVGSVHNDPQFLLRAGTGGCFVNIDDASVVFDLAKDESDWCELLSSQMEEKIHIIGGRTSQNREKNTPKKKLLFHFNNEEYLDVDFSAVPSDNSTGSMLLLLLDTCGLAPFNKETTVEHCHTEFKDMYYVRQFFRHDIYGVLDIMAPDAAYACVWHHALGDVDFEIRKEGTYEECIAFMKEDIEAFVSRQSRECDVFCEGMRGIVDFGDEGDVWDIVEL